VTATTVEISLATVLVAARDQVSTELEGEAVILSLADGVYYGLDGVGALVWERLGEPCSVAELLHAVTSAFDVERETAERDLLALLGELAERRLVTEAGNPA
jgi:hypothetical protein